MRWIAVVLVAAGCGGEAAGGSDAAQEETTAGPAPYEIAPPTEICASDADCTYGGTCAVGLCWKECRDNCDAPAAALSALCVVSSGQELGLCQIRCTDDTGCPAKKPRCLVTEHAPAGFCDFSGVACRPSEDVSGIDLGCTLASPLCSPTTLTCGEG